MAQIFNDYAKYYDLLYKDKDYALEARYIDRLIQKRRPGATVLLDLGCGTGRHDAFLEKLGYSVLGVDLSETMLAEAQHLSIPGRLEFQQGDVRSFDARKTFDVVVSLFHVMSYQVTDYDLEAAFGTAGRHLKLGGIFVFDFWHTAGVLSDPPVIRVKRLENEEIKMVRIAQPVIYPERHVIDVNYQIIILDKQSPRGSELKETHSMRHFSLIELKGFLEKSGFALKDAFEWMTDGPLNSAWNGIVVCEKI